jgi:hypothetical protein
LSRGKIGREGRGGRAIKEERIGARAEWESKREKAERRIRADDSDEVRRFGGTEAERSKRDFYSAF